MSGFDIFFRPVSPEFPRWGARIRQNEYESWWKLVKYGISSICLTKLLMRFFTFDIEWDFPGTEIGVFFKIVLFNIVFFNVVHKSNIQLELTWNLWELFLSSKVSWYPFKNSIGSIFSDWIFLYFLPKVAWGFLQVWLTFLPSLCLCSRCARPRKMVDSGSLGTENGHRVFLWVPQQFLMPAGPCNDRRWVV